MLTRILKYLGLRPRDFARRKMMSIDLGEGDIAIDCGANVGEVTAQLARNGAQVYAFEPNPYAFGKLQETFSDRPNVHCIQKGVLDQSGEMKLYLHMNSDQDPLKWSTGSSLIDFKGNVLKEKFVTVDVVDLCAFIKSLGSSIKILKLDVEGVEPRILKRLIETGTIEKIDHLFVETHDLSVPELKPEMDKVRALICDRGITNIDLDWA